jgi:hypothetical protein
MSLKYLLAHVLIIVGAALQAREPAEREVETPALLVLHDLVAAGMRGSPLPRPWLATT